jgi:DNA-binding response OmpR family regulator
MPVLLLSAVDDDATVVQSLELGAFDYMRKPFSIPELKARLATHLPREEPQLDTGTTDTEE